MSDHTFYFLVWMFGYLITFIYVICQDHDTENWFAYSFICVLTWPLFWTVWIISSIKQEMDKRQNSK